MIKKYNTLAMLFVLGTASMFTTRLQATLFVGAESAGIVFIVQKSLSNKGKLVNGETSNLHHTTPLLLAASIGFLMQMFLKSKITKQLKKFTPHQCKQGLIEGLLSFSLTLFILYLCFQSSSYKRKDIINSNHVYDNTDYFQRDPK